ncbi:glycosyltransferase family 4 protein [Vibrio sp. D420a]|uniref:glycosyltransferase family 4 protein n=1 Tax=Vibrio sp. D420a TaxID=2836895 RepID=UPI002557764F|nr:glycosyltransferase family 4 protein [Vibrio sp. D420a]MDK9762805.1 glycosyltransferase family 4 protein [Vibrio sp. D420a]
MTKSLFIVTTVPITLKGILTGQPRNINKEYDVSLVSSPTEDLAVVGREEGIPVYPVKMERGISPTKDLISLWKMIELFRIHKPYAVHSYTPKAGLIAMLAGFITRVPVRIHTFTGLLFPTAKGFKRYILRQMDRLICACATSIVPEGEGVKNDLYSFGVTDKAMKVIGNGNIAGVDTELFSADLVSKDIALLKRNFGFTADDFVFSFVGRFTEDKGFYELIQAFDKLPQNAKLLLIGSEDERLPLPIDLSKRINDEPRIHVTGWIDDVRAAIGASSILVLPSYREGFPNTPIQAGSMGLPCIVTDVNGSNEIITPGENGWNIPPRDSIALELAMLEAMNCKTLKAMSVNARANIQQKYERSFYINELKKFYREKIG